MAERSGGDRVRSWRAAHLQGLLRQGEPLVGLLLSRPGLARRPAHPREHQEEHGTADPHGCSRSFAGRPGGRSLRRAADSRVSLAPDRFARRRGPLGARRQYQEGPVSFAVGYRQRGGKSGRHGKRENHPHRARRFLRLSESCGGHALVSDHAQVRLSGGFRRDAFGAIARRRREVERRPAGIHRAAGARGHGGGRRRDFSRSSRQSREGALRWHECAAARSIPPAAGKDPALERARARMGCAEEVAPAGNGRKEAR